MRKLEIPFYSFFFVVVVAGDFRIDGSQCSVNGLPLWFFGAVFRS